QQKPFAPIDQARIHRVMDSATSVEEFRQEYAVYLAELEQVMNRFFESAYARQIVERGGLKPMEQLALAKQKLAEL
ncbi:hypothetical protein ACSRCT_22220, partial [Salmonella enterica]|uniref:hypothetical protein n=1 Tax=Salmonella enterica TaxID=28901 RepID=UPI003EDB7045